MLRSDDLKQKIDDVIKLLTVYQSEIDSLESNRKALEQSQIVNTQREQVISLRETEMSKKETDMVSQKKYVEEMSKNASMVLIKITSEKTSLQTLIDQKKVTDQERSQFEEDKRGLETLKAEKEVLGKQLLELESERKLFSKEKRALIEATKLMVTREANIKALEEKLDKIERMTEV